MEEGKEFHMKVKGLDVEVLSVKNVHFFLLWQRLFREWNWRYECQLQNRRTIMSNKLQTHFSDCSVDISNVLAKQKRKTSSYVNLFAYFVLWSQSVVQAHMHTCKLNRTTEPENIRSSKETPEFIQFKFPVKAGPPRSGYTGHLQS